MFPSCTRPCPSGVVLLLSVKSGDAARTKALLDGCGGTDEDPGLLHPDETRDARGYTALHLAAMHGRPEIARLLLEAGASTEFVVAAGENEGLTPLRLAAERGHLSTVRVLLDAGADTGAEDLVDRATCLHAAAEAGHTEVVVELVRGGAELESRAVSGQTPLRWALSMGRASAAAALLSAGADPDAPDRRGACCLHAVAALKSEEGVSCATGAGVVAERSPSSSPAAMAQLLLSSGASPNLGRGGDRFHSQPSANGNLGAGVFDGVLEGNSSRARGVSVGETPLHLAARESSVEVAEVLLRHGADPNAKTSAQEGGMSPLHFAAAPGNDDRRRAIVRLLLQAGADVDAASADGVTSPLKLACLNAGVVCVEELLRRGANDPACVPRYMRPPAPPQFASASVSPSCLLTRLPNVFGTVNPAIAAHDDLPHLQGLVGSRLPDSLRDAADCETILGMLRRAPADRAWRRRGWLIMMYARATSAAAAAASERRQESSHGCLPPAKRERILDEGAVSGNTKSGKSSGRALLREVVGRLFEVQGDQSVLRLVVGWL
ncbi:unnamed protein product [Scytosiphon promiscuus]